MDDSTTPRPCPRCHQAEVEYRGYCRACYNEKQREDYRRKREQHPSEKARERPRTVYHTCLKCGQAERPGLKIYKNGFCRECWSGYMRPYVDRTRERTNERNRQYMQERTRREREAVLNAYGGKCACCGETHKEFLAIDHAYGQGHLERREGKRSGSITLYMRIRKEGYPPAYQILCHNCNNAIGHYGYCPHGNLPPREVAPRGKRRTY